MATQASDNFDRADSGTLGSAWTTTVNSFSMSISGNAAKSPGDPCSNYYNAWSAPADQWSEAILGTLTAAGDDGTGPAVRQSTSQETRYAAYADLAQIIILKSVNGAYSQIGSTAGAGATNDTLYIEAQGTSIVVKKNGSTIISTTDSAIASGQVGVFGSNDPTTQPTLLSWQAGDFTSAFDQAVMAAMQPPQLAGRRRRVRAVAF